MIQYNIVVCCYDKNIGKLPGGTEVKDEDSLTGEQVPMLRLERWTS
jgi:hypothetical protein